MWMNQPLAPCQNHKCRCVDNLIWWWRPYTRQGCDEVSGRRRWRILRCISEAALQDLEAQGPNYDNQEAELNWSLNVKIGQTSLNIGINGTDFWPVVGIFLLQKSPVYIGQSFSLLKYSCSECWAMALLMIKGKPIRFGWKSKVIALTPGSWYLWTKMKIEERSKIKDITDVDLRVILFFTLCIWKITWSE